MINQLKAKQKLNHRFENGKIHPNLLQGTLNQNMYIWGNTKHTDRQKYLYAVKNIDAHTHKNA